MKVSRIVKRLERKFLKLTLCNKRVELNVDQLGDLYSKNSKAFESSNFGEFVDDKKRNNFIIV